MTTNDLKLGDRVRYADNNGAFMDMIVTGQYLSGREVQRPYILIDQDGNVELKSEKLWFDVFDKMEWVKLP